jgi:transketolase
MGVKKILSKEQKKIRKRVLEISFENKFSHLGSCLSSIDLINAVYKVKKKADTFVLSNGHAAIAWYVILEKNGYVDNQIISKLKIHPDRNVNLGIEVSTGSLGQGLPIAIGMALADPKTDCFCLISDGECAEGSIWESLRIADELKLSNLKIIVNVNGWGAYDKIDSRMLVKKIRAFGNKIIIVDGHKPAEIEKALKIKSEYPLVVIAKTKVNHLPFLKGQDAHYFVMNEDHFREGIKDFI